MVKESYYLAIDPGTDKCGLAILDSSGVIHERSIVPVREIQNDILGLLSKYQLTCIIVGFGTGRKLVEKELTKIDLRNNIIFVPEKNTTLEARKRYWLENPPKGFWKIFPTSLRTPPQPIDDYAAVILAEKFLKTK